MYGVRFLESQRGQAQQKGSFSPNIRLPADKYHNFLSSGEGWAELAMIGVGINYPTPDKSLSPYSEAYEERNAMVLHNY